jgi:signal transduction histidine kinase
MDDIRHDEMESHSIRRQEASLMKQASLPINRTFRYIEWSLIGLYILLAAGNGSFSVSSEISLKILTFLGGYGILSFVLPMRRPLWQRLAYILSGVSIEIYAEAVDILLTLFLYLYAAKSCFLLTRKQAILAAIAILLLKSISYLWLLPSRLDLNLTKPLSSEQLVQARNALLDAMGFHFALIAFTLLFSLMAVAERTSRQKAELLAQEVEALATRLERTRIARDMHDSLGHTLTNLDMQLAMAQRWYKRDSEQGMQALATAKQLANQCIEEAGRSLQVIRQQQFELNSSLNKLLDQFKRNTSAHIQTDINLPELPQSASYHLYCIFKEGLINIQKHAHASRIWLQGQSTADGILVEIKDNGKGFEPETAGIGLGLIGIAERAQLLGGRLVVLSAPHQGTQIQILIPPIEVKS